MGSSAESATTAFLSAAMKQMDWLRGMLWQQRGTLLLMYGFMVFHAVCTSLFALLSGPVLATLFDPSSAWTKLGRSSSFAFLQSLITPWAHTLPQQRFALPALIVLVAFCKAIAQIGQYYLLAKFSNRIAFNIRHRIFHQLLHQEYAFYQKYRHGDLLSRFTSDVQIIEQGLFQGVGPLLRDSLAIFLLLTFCLFKHPSLSLYTAIVLPFSLFCLAGFAKMQKNAAQRTQKALGELNAHFSEAILGVATIAAYNQADFEEAMMQKFFSRHHSAAKRAYWLKAIRPPMVEFLGAVCLTCLLVVMMVYRTAWNMNPTDIVSFFAAVLFMYEPVKRLGVSLDYLVSSMAASERLSLLLQQSIVSTMPSTTDLQLPIGKLPQVAFCHVDFSFNHCQVLCNMQLVIAPGETLALVGKSGAGKSTVAKLLIGFYRPHAGSICIDGFDIAHMSLLALRRQVVYIGQDSFLFHRKVRDNIAYGCPDASFEEVVAAAKMAQAYDFIMQLPQGFDTVVSEAGSSLSGGQKQRICIARALVTKAPIVIMDEATSQLDAQSEQVFKHASQAWLAPKTALIIAHRLETVMQADRVALLEAGRIVAVGSHHQLAAECSAYQMLFGINAAA